MAIHSSIYDPVGSRLIPFGGKTYMSGPINEAWSLSLDPAPLWQRIQPAGPVPEPRYSHVAIYDRLRERMVLYSGFGGATGDVWTLALSGAPHWASVSSYGETPAPTYTTARAFYDPVEDRMIFFLSFDQYRGFPTLWAGSMTQLGRFSYLSTEFLRQWAYGFRYLEKTVTFR
jgi:hypothetical protein